MPPTLIRRLSTIPPSDRMEISATAKPGSPEILALQGRKKEGEIVENSLVISPALDYIEENYMQQFTIEYLAELCH